MAARLALEPEFTSSEWRTPERPPAPSPLPTFGAQREPEIQGG